MLFRSSSIATLVSSGLNVNFSPVSVLKRPKLLERYSGLSWCHILPWAPRCALARASIFSLRALPLCSHSGLELLSLLWSSVVSVHLSHSSPEFSSIGCFGPVKFKYLMRASAVHGVGILLNILVRPTGSGTGADGPAEALAALDDPIVAGFTMASMASSSSLLDPSWNGLDMMWWRQLLAADGRKLHAAANSLANKWSQNGYDAWCSTFLMICWTVVACGRR